MILFLLYLQIFYNAIFCNFKHLLGSASLKSIFLYFPVIYFNVAVNFSFQLNKKILANTIFSYFIDWAITYNLFVTYTRIQLAPPHHTKNSVLLNIANCSLYTLNVNYLIPFSNPRKRYPFYFSVLKSPKYDLNYAVLFYKI